MKRQLEIALLVVLVAAVLGFVFLTRSSRESGEIPSGEELRETSLARETTIRNVTDLAISYRIYPSQKPEEITEKSISPGTIDRYRTDGILEIEFNDGEKDIIYSLDPGTPYSFRYDQGTRIDLFLGAHGRSDAEDLAPYVPTPQVVVDEMLRIAGVTEKDVIYDLGCGDGRFVITAATRYGARGVGIDIDKRMVEDSIENAREAGVEDLVRFIEMDATKADVSEATVVTLYLLPESNALLRPKLEAQLKPGARVICHNYTMPGWEDKETESVTLKDENGEEHSIFAYVK
jgi:16S rRNA G966 N2-methylase RsmD